ncbi:MAG: glycoside hydrolase [Ferruginibacter sp.]|nr:glycoside hydrolase [Ferruginibacter sp.]
MQQLINKKNRDLVSKHVCFLLLFFVPFNRMAGQQPEHAVIVLDSTVRYQVIGHFGASDAWAGQFAGGWPAAKKNTIADWLFSTDTLLNGNPKGIGLSMWRYNLGAGSAEQGAKSGIPDEWRRAALTLGQDPKLAAQNWFLQAAKQRGVQQFLAFYNSPPIQFTRNGKAYAPKGRSNIDSSKYQDFADYTVAAINHLERASGIKIDYLSPVNEPQWDWSDGTQEGCPYTNAEISALTKTFSKTFQENQLNTQLVITEAGQHTYLLHDGDKPGKGNQVNAFFDPASPQFVGDLTNVSRTIASHSYFTTSPLDTALLLRKAVQRRISDINNLAFWQSEYCILGDNAGEIRGEQKDLGMNAALYLAKVVYQDLVAANASAWDWWTALSAYDYKDGLVYIQKSEKDGAYSDSKMLWAMGNYSLFLRPGMQRISATVNNTDLCVSAFRSDKGKQVIVIVNPTKQAKAIAIKQQTTALPKGTLLRTYTTNETGNLHKNIAAADELKVPAEAVVSFIID